MPSWIFKHVYTSTDHLLPVDGVDLAPVPLCVAMVVEGATIEGGHAHDPTLHHGGGTDVHEGDQGMCAPQRDHSFCCRKGKGRGGGNHRPLATQRGMWFW